MGDPLQEARGEEQGVPGSAPAVGRSGNGDVFVVVGFNLKTQRPKEMYLIIFFNF